MTLVDFPVQEKPIQTKSDLKETAASSKLKAGEQKDNIEQKTKSKEFNSILEKTIKIKASVPEAKTKRLSFDGLRTNLLNRSSEKGSGKNRITDKAAKTLLSLDELENPDEVQAVENLQNPDFINQVQDVQVLNESTAIVDDASTELSTLITVETGEVESLSRNDLTENQDSELKIVPHGQKPAEKGSTADNEHRGTGKESKGQRRFTIVDLRNSRAETSVNNGAVDVSASETSLNLESGETQDPAVRTIRIETGFLQNSNLSSNQPEAPVQSSVDLLFGSLKERGNAGIVKQTGILLKNNNSGEIRLILKPEKLGKVRIRLNLQDNNLAGKIIVENNTVREVFNNNMDELMRAFKEGGFNVGNLDVSVEGDGRGDGKGGEKKSSRRNIHAAAVIENSVPLYDREESIVDLVV